jgi:hypothetical protein
MFAVLYRGEHEVGTHCASADEFFLHICIDRDAFVRHHFPQKELPDGRVSALKRGRRSLRFDSVPGA